MKPTGVRSLVCSLLLGGCAGGAAPPDWQLNASSALQAFQQHYLKGEAKLAAIEFARAKDELRRTGRGDLLARAELARCAVRAASLEFDDCPGFEGLRAEAGPEEVAYAEYLAGRREREAADDAVARLVGAGVLLRNGRISPAQIAAATEVASAQGWRRPLLAWLGVQEKRAEAAGDREAAVRIRRRMAWASGRDPE